MITLLFVFLSTLSFGIDMPVSWSSAFKIKDVHEFYPENKVITEPRESWQQLFSVLILNDQFEEQKDCVFYYVPGELPGRMKVKTVGIKEDCSDFILKAGDNEWNEVQDLQFARSEEGLKLHFTHKKQNISWEIVTPKFNPPETGLHISSAEIKSPRYLLLAKANDSKKTERLALIKDQICHNINDECEEVSPSLCHLCEGGWYEIPNGCAKGPKYCGQLDCGGRNRPACRRGRDYQKKEKNFDCRIDPSFAYCQKGFSIQCEGQKAYCR